MGETTFTLNMSLANDEQLRSLLDSREEWGLTPAIAGIDASGEPFLAYATGSDVITKGFNIVTGDPEGGGLIRGGQLAYPVDVKIQAVQR